MPASRSSLRPQEPRPWALNTASEQDRAPFDWLGQDRLQPLRRQVRVRRSEVEVERDVGHTGNANGSGRPLASSVRARRLRRRDQSRGPARGPRGRRAARPVAARRAGRPSPSRPPRSTTTTCGRCGASASGADALPMILGCDAAGLDEDGNEVVVHAVITSDSWRGDETLDPRRSLLSERYPGALAEKVAVPARNVIAQAARAVLRARRLPADGVADRLPDAVHPRRRHARDDGARPGRRRRRRHRADRARQRRRASACG